MDNNEYIICPKCGTKNSKVNFCAACGTSLSGGDIKMSARRARIMSKQDNSATTHDNKSDVVVAQKGGESDTQGEKSGSGHSSLQEKWKGLNWFCKLAAIIILINLVMIPVFALLKLSVKIIISIIIIVGTCASVILHNKKFVENKKIITYIALAVMVVGTAANLIAGWKSTDKAKEVEGTSVKKVILPEDYDKCVGGDYLEAVDYYRELGFTSIEILMVEDLSAAEDDRINKVASVTIDTEAPQGGEQYGADSKVAIYYHELADCNIKLHINFDGNLIFNKYDVDFELDGEEVASIPHGKDRDYDLTVKPGKHTFSFYKAGDRNIKSEIVINIESDIATTITVGCDRDEIKAEEKDAN